MRLKTVHTAEGLMAKFTHGPRSIPLVMQGCLQVSLEVLFLARAREFHATRLMVAVGHVFGRIETGLKQCMGGCRMSVVGHRVRGSRAHRDHDTRITIVCAARRKRRTRGTVSRVVFDLKKISQGRVRICSVETVPPILSPLLHLLIAQTFHEMYASGKDLARFTKGLVQISIGVSSSIIGSRLP